MNRRDVLKLGLAAGGAGLLARDTTAQDREKGADLLKYLCPPDGFPDQLSRPSPKVAPFVQKLEPLPVKSPVSKLDPPPDPSAHQRYDEFRPRKLYEIRETEFQWQYHPHAPYSDSSGRGVCQDKGGAQNSFRDWGERSRLPRGGKYRVDADRDSDLTLLYVNNTIYAEFSDRSNSIDDAVRIDFTRWKLRGTTLKGTIYNGDNFEHGYQNVDFGGGRGWENQFKSSVKVGGSGCWFTFGRAHWWMNIPYVKLSFMGNPERLSATFDSKYLRTEDLKPSISAMCNRRWSTWSKYLSDGPYVPCRKFFVDSCAELN